MATHDYNLANQTGANFRADLNNALSAILSNNASATEPSTTTAYMLWVDTTNNLLKMRNSSDDGWVTLPVSITTSNTVDIDGGTVNTITSLSFSSGATITSILDEDDLSSDDASALATQQSIKAYVDSQVTAQDLDFQGDTGGALSIDLDSETFTISGGNGVTTSGSLNTLTIAIDSSVVTLTDTQTLTNKSIDADSNTISNLEVDNLKSGVLDTDLTSVSASDDTLASSKAIKTYVDAQVTAQDLDLTDGTTSISIDLDSETLSVLGGTGVTSTASGNGVTLAIGQDVGTTADVTFNTVSADLTGDVTGTVSSIANHSTTNLSEGTNLYYTTARFDSAFSGKSTSDLTEGANLYFTDERVDDRVNNLLVAGSNVTLTYNDVANTLTIAATEDNLSNNTTDDLSEGSTNLYYTDERVDDRVAALIQDGTGISWSYVDASGTLTPTISLSPFSTSDLSEGSNLYYTTARFDSAFSGKSTSDLTEGTNLYYTDARARAAISVSGDLSYNSTTGVLSFTERTDAEVRGLISASGDLSYNSTTGVISFTERTDAEVRGLVSASGDLSYNSTTGVFSFTERTDSEVRALLSGGTGVTYNSSTGEIAIGQAVSTTSDVTFNDVIISGDLTVSGTTTTVNTETINLADNIILFNSNATGTPSENAGIEIERGDATNKTLLWNETDDKWTVGSETFVAGTFEGNITGNVTGTVSDISNHDTDDLSEGASNLYYTTARFDSAFSGKSTSDLSEGTNLYHTTERVQDITGGQFVTNGTHTGISFAYDDAGDGAIDATVSLSGFSTSDLSEGTNLYYTTARFDTAFSGKDTDDLTEGASNQYFTTARARSSISASGDISYNSTTGVISFTASAAPVTSVNTLTGAVVLDTDDISEGSTNLYYTDARVDSHLSGGTGVTYSSGSISIGQSVGTGDSVTFAGVTSDFTGDIEGAVKFTAKADVALTKGQVVYISGISGDVPTVNLADADNSSAMPAFGLVYANANQNASVEIITFGSLSGFDTSGFSVGDTVYVSTTAGALTATAPTGESSLIQNIGIVQRSHASAGIIKVGGAGRTNATPNLNSGKIFYGNGSNQSVATTLDTSIVPESGNLYYTDARANSAIDTRVTKSFVDALGIAASTATTLATARDFSLTGDVTAAGVSFDGSGNVALTTSIGSNTVGITELNVTDGTSGQALVTDGAGNLSFSTVAVDQTLTVIGRSANVDINITSGTLVVEGRAGNVNVGV